MSGECHLNVYEYVNLKYIKASTKNLIEGFENSSQLKKSFKPLSVYLCHTWAAFFLLQTRFPHFDP